MNYFVYEGKKVFYKETGTGKPLIFLHGNTASSRMFEQIAGEYSKNFRVVLIDFLGHGKSYRLDQNPLARIQKWVSSTASSRGKSW